MTDPTPVDPMCCAVCLYDNNDATANVAVTVIEGYAVCYDHLGYVAQGQRFSGIVTAARQDPITRPAIEEPDDAR